jgi:hypothetical protein
MRVGGEQNELGERPGGCGRMEHVSAGRCGEGPGGGRSLRREDAIGLLGFGGTDHVWRSTATYRHRPALGVMLHAAWHDVGLAHLQSTKARRRLPASQHSGLVTPDAYKRALAVCFFLVPHSPFSNYPSTCLHPHPHSPSILSGDAPVSEILKQRAARQPHRLPSIVATISQRGQQRFV